MKFILRATISLKRIRRAVKERVGQVKPLLTTDFNVHGIFYYFP